MVASEIFCIGGFTQHKGRLSGIVRCALALDDMLPAGHKVHPCDWNECWWEWAEFAWLRWQQQGGPPPAILVAAYSYGGGWGFIRLAEELRRRGMRIKRAVLCDAVYRHGYPWGAWRAFYPFSKIVVPDNVERVTWFYQRYNLPAGHRVVAEDPARTRIDDGIQIHATHQYADDSDEFRSAVLAAAKSIANSEVER